MAATTSAREHDPSGVTALEAKDRKCLRDREHGWRFSGLGFTFLILSIAALLVLGCRTSVDRGSKTLTVSAAVSLKESFAEIAVLYERRTGRKVLFNFGASGALQKQIEAGAPADVFASAGEKQMDELNSKGLIVGTSRKNLARNELVLIVPPSSKAVVASLNDLTNAQVAKIAVGNPRTVPAGQYTQQVFERLKLLPQIQSKLVLAEDVRQVLDYVVRGEVDAGIVYATDAAASGDKVKVVSRAPVNSHDPILYPIAIIKESQPVQAANEFIELVRSPEGQSILSQHGFLSPE